MLAAVIVKIPVPAFVNEAEVPDPATILSKVMFTLFVSIVPE